MKIKKLALWILVVSIGIILGYIWFGFLFPDPYYVSRLTFIGRVIYQWGPRISIPLFYTLLIIIIVMKNRKSAKILSMWIFIILLVGLIAYPILDILYFSKTQLHRKVITKQYHPYLQLKPNLPEKIENTYGENTLRIFCLGGSTTEFKNNKGIGWPEMLEKKLRIAYNSDSVSVYNLGRQWYTTLHSLINYETNLREYKPDVIILMHNINDFLHNADFSYLSNGPFRQDYGHFMGPSANIFGCNGLFGSHWPRLTAMWYHEPRDTIEQHSFPGLESFTRNINTLIELAKLDSVNLILMTQPNILSNDMDDQIKQVCNMVNFEAVGKKSRWDYSTAHNGMRLYNERIKEISELNGVNFIDLEKYVPKTLTFFSDEVHYSDTTFTIISDVIANEIISF